MNTLEKLQSDFMGAIYEGADFDAIAGEYCDNLDIYRNNLYLGLWENLRSKFPIVEQLLGAEFFKNMAFEFIRSNNLGNGHNNEFGRVLSAFLNLFLDLEYRFIAKIAEIEWAKFCAEAAENTPNANFAQISAAFANGNSNIGLHPSFGIVKAGFNAMEIYFAQLRNENCEIVEIEQEIAIWRDANFDPCFKTFDGFEAAIIEEMSKGEKLGVALENAISKFGATQENQTSFAQLCEMGIFRI